MSGANQMITRPRASSPCSSNRCVIAVFIRPSPITPMRFSAGFFMTPPTVMPAAGGRHAKSAKSISKSATIGRPRFPSIAGGRTKGGWGATGAWSEPLDKINFAGKIQTPRDLLDRKSFIGQQWLRLIESRAAQKLVKAFVLGGLEQRPQTGVADMSDTGQFRRPPDPLRWVGSNNTLSSTLETASGTSSGGSPRMVSPTSMKAAIRFSVPSMFQRARSLWTRKPRACGGREKSRRSA